MQDTDARIMRAHDNALEALTLIKMHIQSCDKRYGTIIKLLGWGGGVTVMLLISSLAYFLVRFGLPGALR